MLNIDWQNALNILAVSFIPTLLGIILHEVAHGWVAKRCGDLTAYYAGRLTLNPVTHIDPVGLFVFGLTSLSGSFVFGWAKPVPVNPRFFRNPKRDLMLVSLAGPATNFLLAIVFAIGMLIMFLLFPLEKFSSDPYCKFVFENLKSGIIINCGLGWLNLIPVPPLDGSKILAWLLPDDIAEYYLSLSRFGFVILMLLVISGCIGIMLNPVVLHTYKIIIDSVKFLLINVF